MFVVCSVAGDVVVVEATETRRRVTLSLKMVREAAQGATAVAEDFNEILALVELAKLPAGRKRARRKPPKHSVFQVVRRF